MNKFSVKVWTATRTVIQQSAFMGLIVAIGAGSAIADDTVCVG